MRGRGPRAGAVAALAALIAACGPAVPTPTGSSVPGTIPAASVAPPTSAPPATATPSPAPTATSAAVATELVPCAVAIATETHQAPELEALLPASVDGRTLLRWSVRGLCVINLFARELPDGEEAFLDDLFGPGSSATVDPDHLAYAVAGRNDTEVDPPHFVFAAARPGSADERDLNLFFLLAGAGVEDVTGAMNLDGFTARTIAGREVWVGTADLLASDEHQQGTPYLYWTETAFFLVVGSPDWAVMALSQLPEPVG